MNFRCPICSQSMQCPDDVAGRSATCPKCKNKFVIPALPPPAKSDKEPIPETSNEIVVKEWELADEEKPKSPPKKIRAEVPRVLHVLPVKEQDTHLAPCTACGRSIAKEAASCPNCGAPNKWVHPEIIRFYQSIEQFEFKPWIQFNYEKFVLFGVDERSRKDAEGISNLANSFSVIAPMNLSGLATIMSVRAGQSWVSEWAKKKIKAFRIDFSYSPPSWSSTDDEFWLDVMDFFGVPLPRAPTTTNASGGGKTTSQSTISTVVLVVLAVLLATSAGMTGLCCLCLGMGGANKK